MNNLKFSQAIETESSKKGIGTLNERTLHAILKQYYEPDALKTEVKIGSYYADIFNENGIIEIQTRGFASLRRKLEFFLVEHRVTIVFPIATKKWLIWVDAETGEVTLPRKSPKKGQVYEIFRELYAIKPLLKHDNLKIMIVLMEMEEYRYLNGWSKDKKKGSVRMDRIPKQLVDEIPISCVMDYSKLIPQNLPTEFTAKDFKTFAKIPLKQAQVAVNVLCSLDVIKKAGKIKNAFLYSK